MKNVLEFIYAEFSEIAWLGDYVWDKIFYWKSPVGTQWPMIIYKDISDAKINFIGTRNDFIQISVWWKDWIENDNIKGLLIQHFHMLKKSPVKNVNVKKINNSFDKETQMFWKHLTIHVKLQDSF